MYTEHRKDAARLKEKVKMVNTNVGNGSVKAEISLDIENSKLEGIDNGGYSA